MENSPMAGQLALDDRWTDTSRPVKGRAATAGRAATEPVLCAACRAREARYGFRGDADDPQADRPRTLCFECFRAEIARRQEAAQAVQGRLPLAPHRAGPGSPSRTLARWGGGVRDGDPALKQTLDSLSRRRRRAQIAARRALAVSGF
jgi:hypothetical protein